MANALYTPFKVSLLNKELDLDTDDLRVILLKSGYSFVATHQYVSDLTPGSNEVSRSVAAMTTPSIVGGVFDADDVVFTSLTGSVVASVVIFAFAGGADSARKLIAYIDNFTGLPFTPNGGNLTLQWDNGTNKIFKLTG